MIPEISELATKLKSRVDTGRIELIHLSDSSIKIQPKTEDTFAIDVMFDAGKWTIESQMWHHHYEELREVNALICWLLTPYYRIVESRKQGNVLSAWIEIYTNEGWESADRVYYIHPSEVDLPENAMDEITIYQQAVFLDSAFASYHPNAPLDKAGYPVGTLVGRTSYEFRNDGWYPVGVPDAE